MNITEAITKGTYPYGNIGNSYEKEAPGEKRTYNVGFIDPAKPSYQGDGIANDETQFDAESLEDLVSLYETFCEENGLPKDTVTYVEVEGCSAYTACESAPEKDSTTESTYRQYLNAIIENLLVAEKPATVIGYLLHIGMSKKDIMSFSFSERDITEAEECNAGEYFPAF